MSLYLCHARFFSRSILRYVEINEHNRFNTISCFHVLKSTEKSRLIVLQTLFCHIITIVTPPLSWHHLFVKKLTNKIFTEQMLEYIFILFHFNSMMLPFYVNLIFISSLFTIISGGNIEHTLLRGVPVSRKYTSIELNY